MYESLSGPMRSLLSRGDVPAAGTVVGLGRDALGLGGAPVVPLAVAGAPVFGELRPFAAAEIS